MKFRFIGTYTGDRDSINAGGVVFHDRAASEVTDAELVRRLKNNPEFEAVAASGEPKAKPGPKKAKAKK